MGRIKTTVFVAAGLLMIVFMLQNFFAGELSPTGFCIMVLGTGLILLPLFGRALKKLSKRCYHIMSVFGYCIIAVILAIMIALTSIMIPAAHDNLSGIAEDTPVIVPGCLLHGDEPGEMLQSRLDTAQKYLESHPNAICVVCGGAIGSYTQAEIMKKYLMQHGISESRILMDDKSNTTYENMENAKVLLSGKKEVVIATDVYHEYRSKYYAKRLNLQPYALASKTPLRHYLDSWPREYLAIIKAWITGE